MPQYYNSIAEKLGPEKVSVGWPWRLFVFSFLIAVAAAVIYGGLAFGYRSYLDNQISEADKAIEELAASIPEDQQKNLRTFYSQMANLQILLNKHVLSSKIFPLLQQNTNKQISYKTLEIKISERRLVIDGLAASYQIFAQQLEAFNRLASVERVIINESRLENGRVAFRLTVVLKQGSVY